MFCSFLSPVIMSNLLAGREIAVAPPSWGPAAGWGWGCYVKSALMLMYQSNLKLCLCNTDSFLYIVLFLPKRVGTVYQ